MSVTKIKEQLAMLIKLHRSLNEIAIKKTDIIIKGDADRLQSILKDESKHIQAIGQTNNVMIAESRDFLERQGILTEPNVTAVLEYIAAPEQKEIKQLREELQEQVSLLKTKNEVNQGLLEQSMDFIHLSLDLLLPDIESYNYGSREQSSPSKQDARSIFDSKA